MGKFIDSRSLRQERYRTRARRARLLGWALVPVTSALVSVALWSDPVVQPKLLAGLEVVKPMILAVTERSSALESAQEQQNASFVAAAEFNTEISAMPASKTPINRPEIDG